MPIRTIHYGIGAIGIVLAREVAARAGFEIAGAIDAAPDKAGALLGDVVGVPAPGVRIIPPSESDWPHADVVLHATTSFAAAVIPQLRECVDRGLNVVTSCEELAVDGQPPWLNAAMRAQLADLDRAAKGRGVSVLATGVNPGFTMDTLPVMLSAVCVDVRSMRVTRVLDAANRRLPFQRKIGAGLRREEFELKAAAGGFGHVGLRESAASVAYAFGWEPFEIVDRLQPLFADKDVASPNLSVRRGEVAGLHQRMELKFEGEVRLVLDLVMAMGATDPRDEVEIDGEPPLRMVIPGGVQGDRATVGIMINAARAIDRAPPGLITMRDVPPVHWRVDAR